MGYHCMINYFLASVLLWQIVILLSNNVSNVVGSPKKTPCEFSAIFNFGDSNSDTGGLSATFGQAPPPNGESFFGGPAGRYSDGRLVVDFIAESLGLRYLSAFLDSMATNFTQGANFATSGSTVRPQNTTIQQSGYSPIALNIQSYQFNDFHRRSQIYRKQGGIYKRIMPKEEDFSRALYTIDIGQNDLTAGYFLNMTVEQVKDYVPDVLDQFSFYVKNMYYQGGRSFWIHNTGPVGCLPYVMDRLPVKASQVDRVGCSSPYNEVAQYFNARLNETIVQLRNDLPLAAVTYVDVYSAKYNLISHARKHGCSTYKVDTGPTANMGNDLTENDNGDVKCVGFKHPLRACCGYGGKYNYNEHVGCGGKVVIKGKEVLIGKSCNDPRVRINWDGVHYTEAANKFVFDQIVNGKLSDPPRPLNMACHRHY